MKTVVSTECLIDLIKVVLLIVVSIPSLAVAMDLPGIKKSGACAVCHIDWMVGADQGAPLMPVYEYVMADSGKQKVVSTKRMCFSCHDGFVNDSRFQFGDDTHNHPVGVKPSDKVKGSLSGAGYTYPLNEEGKLYCGTCHTAHGDAWDSQGAIFMRNKNINSSMCMDCHREKKSAKINHPLKRINKTLSEKLIGVDMELGTGGQMVCQSCHGAHNAKGKKLLVEDSQRSELCTVCHDDKKALLKGEHNLVKNEAFLKTAKGKEMAARGPCASCHVSHGAVDTPLLANIGAGFGVAAVESSSRCVVCHNKDGLASKTDLGHFSHPVDVPVESLGIDVTAGQWVKKGGGDANLVSLPLFDSTGKAVRNGGNVQCSTCHDPHATSSVGKSNFLRMELGKNSTLCVNCHTRNAAVINSKHNVNLYDAGRKGKLPKHTVTGQGVCSACHRAHKGDAPQMLQLGAVGESVSLIQAQCEACHIEKGAAKHFAPDSFNHPNLIEVKKQRGKLPLFSLTGKRVDEPGRGKIDCTTCHNVHVWDAANPALKIKDAMTIKAHTGNSFLRVTAAGDSPLCTGCHEHEAGVINTEHDYRVVDSWLDYNSKQKSLKAGVCNQCHASHNAVSKTAIWGRSPGKAKNIQASFCRSCHSSMNRISNKVVNYGKHPDHVLSWNQPKRNLPLSADVDLMPVTPVFSEAGKEVSVGIISCPSCHDPHQWSGAKLNAAPGIEREGGSSDSFLRNHSVEEMVCADCHGLDAIFRYQYFHSHTNTKKHPLYLDAPGKDARNMVESIRSR
ncbi:MAG: cytochrome c3 family protein [Gammaproteobacteria bacterium]|nr:cytochrome c3 family protein [Gammaproteobacteria bacterium]MDH5800057.1 cytochrome c3 family protein [Gammaproteobacteria bacterium]